MQKTFIFAMELAIAHAKHAFVSIITRDDQIMQKHSQQIFVHISTGCLDRPGAHFFLFTTLECLLIQIFVCMNV